jgi:hypothetical protein
MKTNQKQLQLIKYGLKPSTVTNLTESQVNLLFKKLLESKKETNEVIQVSKTDTNMINQLKTQKKPFEMYEDDTEIDVANASKGEFTQDKVQQPSPDGTDDERGKLEEEIKRLVEKFESKKQQKYFFAKCGDGKTKEQKKWCKMADEFASKTKNFKKLPEKKKEETKESMDNYTKKVASAFAGGLKEKLNKININPTFGESEMEKQVLRLVEKHITPKMTKKEFLNLVKEQGTKTAPVKPDIDIDTPTKPSKPATPYKPKPGVKPAPKAGKEAPVKPGVKPDVDTPTRPSKPATPYKPKPGVKPAPKAGRESMPTWLTFDEIGINLK